MNRPTEDQCIVVALPSRGETSSLKAAWAARIARANARIARAKAREEAREATRPMKTPLARRLEAAYVASSRPLPRPAPVRSMDYADLLMEAILHGQVNDTAPRRGD